MEANLSKVLWLTANLLSGVALLTGTLSMVFSSWMVSEFVNTGLFTRCITYPGRESCSGIATSSELNTVQTMFGLMMLSGFTGATTNILSQTSQDKSMRFGSGVALLVSGLCGLLGAALYTISFTLCAKSSYGSAFVYAWTSSICHLAASAMAFSSSSYMAKASQSRSHRPRTAERPRTKPQPHTRHSGKRERLQKEQRRKRRH